jgi:zinc transporter ZupT
MIASEFSGGHDDHRLLEGDHDDHDDHGDESAATWRWGASIMGGFLFPVVLHAFFPNNHPVGHSHDDDNKAEESPSPAAEESADSESGADGADAVVDLEKPISDKTEEASDTDESNEDGYVTLCGCLRLKNVSLFMSMNLGEMLHNFTDGIFVGAAYIGCGPALGNSVVLTTILHEIPNQLAGYLVMVNQNGIDPIVALFLNFLFGLSVLVGALVVLTLDVGNNAIGCIFAIGGGVFLHVAISEMLGTAERNVMRKQHWLWVLISFVFGAVLIGLVLMNHDHCGEL